MRAGLHKTSMVVTALAFMVLQFVTAADMHYLFGGGWGLAAFFAVPITIPFGWLIIWLTTGLFPILEFGLLVTGIAGLTAVAATED